jgi:hypothetical protein
MAGDAKENARIKRAIRFFLHRAAPKHRRRYALIAEACESCEALLGTGNSA